MEIICDNCSAKLNVPDEKIPQGQQVSITCPKCKTKLAVKSRADASMESAPAAGEKDSAGAGPANTALEFYEAGAKLALIAENNAGHIEKIKQAVEGLGYRSVVVSNTGEAISKMRLHAFDLVLISDKFDDIELAQSPVRQYLNHLPMSIRRQIFVALLGDSFNSMDQMTAFALSANLVINTRDSGKFTEILENAISDNEKFYKVYMDSLAEAGKA